MQRKKAVRWITLAVGVAIFILVGRALPFADWLAAFGAWISGLGPAAFPLYAGVFVLCTVLLGPAWLMTIGAGLFFGLLPGAGVVSAGSMLGAAASFLIGRHLARDRVARYAKNDLRFNAIDRAIARKGWRIVFLLRLSPLVPFTISNYFYGLTGIRFWPYALATWAGTIPIILLYASFGAAGRQAAGPEPNAMAAWKWALLAGGVIVTLAGTAYVARVARQALESEREGERPVV